MGTKNNITLDSAANAAQLASPKQPNGTAPMAGETAIDKQKRSARAETDKPAAGTNAAPAPVRGLTQEDIALRAYFIGEHRRARALPGDQHQDWLEAERQIIAETQTTAGSKSRKTKR